MTNIEQLLEKLRRGTATPDELKILKTLLQAQKELSHFLDSDLENVDYPINKEQSEFIWSGIQQQISGVTTTDEKDAILRKLVYRRVASVAAAILIFTVFTWYFLYKDTNPAIMVVENTAISAVKLVKLPDGSKVWLNHHSKISYPTRFSDSIRQVTMEGEAFFEVKKDAQHPFMAKNNDLQIRVLGTSFNVQAYPADDKLEVALVEGKVQIEFATASADTSNQIVRLTPGQQFSYDKTHKKYITERFEKDKPYAWKEGVIYFDGANVYEVTETLQKWYDVKFTLQNDSLMKSELVYRYDTDKFTLPEVLDHITQVTDYKFKRMKNGEYVVIPK